MHDLAVLNKKFATLGFNRKPVGRHLAELVLHLAMAVGGAFAFVVVHGMAAKAGALLIMTLGNLGLTNFGHSASHNGITERTWINRGLLLLTFGAAFGTSSTWWVNKHIVVHHTTPNVIGLDDDVALFPWLALTEDEARTGGPWRRRYFRYQWMILPLVMALTAASMTLSSWRYLAAAIAAPRRRSAQHFADTTAIVIHFALWIALPLLWFKASDVVGFYFLRNALLGFVVFLTSAPAHFPAEARFLSTEGYANRGTYRRHSDYILLQTSTTVNFRAGWIGELFCCGAQYQIEHHLFPGISHAYYPRMSPHLRAYCIENGYPYQVLGWGTGIWRSLRVFWRPKRVEPALNALRERALRDDVSPLTAES